MALSICKSRPFNFTYRLNSISFTSSDGEDVSQIQFDVVEEIFKLPKYTDLYSFQTARLSSFTILSSDPFVVVNSLVSLSPFPVFLDHVFRSRQ